MRFPGAVLVFSFAMLWLALKIGARLRVKGRPMGTEERDDFNVVQGAVMTLLALIIGFTFSMAITRYDLRKEREEEEANAIGTEYLRGDLLSAASAVKVRGLLKSYLDERIAFYRTRNEMDLDQINRETFRLQAQMWSTVSAEAAAQSTATHTLVASGMNDVLNSQGYTQAAWANRIPVSAWVLMGVIAVLGCLLIGNGSHKAGTLMLIVLPLVISVAFFLISDIDSPRRGLIRTRPDNLLALSKSLKSD
jgi:hypothetical protein